MKHKVRVDIRQIERKNYHLFINLEVNGTHCRLLIDTGASKTVFDTERVLRFTEAHKIEHHELKSVGLGVSDMETQMATLKNICVGKLKIRKMQVAILPIAHVNQTYNQLKLPEIDGVLGSDFLMKYKAVLDYNKAILRLEK